ncbi:MAG: hypothetical protein ACREYF_02800 [Gammaproteobacteria bacterium]
MVKNSSENDSLVSYAQATEFFQQSVTNALSNQNTRASETTVCYLVNLLISFIRSDQFYELTSDGLVLKPLALFYADAAEAESIEQRNKALQRLGDVALFVAGMFSESLRRKPVDVGYYVGMGVSAYSHLSETIRGTVRGRAFAEVFHELAGKFQEFVDVLAEIAESGQINSNCDIMRLYELWLQTGSKRAANRLRAVGIVPIRGSGGYDRH